MLPCALPRARPGQLCGLSAGGVHCLGMLIANPERTPLAFGPRRMCLGLVWRGSCGTFVSGNFFVGVLRRATWPPLGVVPRVTHRTHHSVWWQKINHKSTNGLKSEFKDSALYTITLYDIRSPTATLSTRPPIRIIQHAHRSASVCVETPALLFPTADPNPSRFPSLQVLRHPDLTAPAALPTTLFLPSPAAPRRVSHHPFLQPSATSGVDEA